MAKSFRKRKRRNNYSYRGGEGSRDVTSEEHKNAQRESQEKHVIFLMSSMSEKVEERVTKIISSHPYTDLIFAMCPFNIKKNFKNDNLTEETDDKERIKNGKIILENIKKLVKGKFIPIDIPAPIHYKLIQDEINKNLVTSWPMLGPAGGEFGDKIIAPIDSFRIEMLFDVLLWMHFTKYHTPEQKTLFSKELPIAIELLNYMYMMNEGNFTNFFNDIINKINSQEEGNIYSITDINNISDDVNLYLNKQLDIFTKSLQNQQLITDSSEPDIINKLLDFFNHNNKTYENLDELRKDLESFKKFENYNIKKFKKEINTKKLGDMPDFRVDTLFKLIYSNYNGAFVDVNYAVPLLCFQYGLLSMDNANVHIHEEIKQHISLDKAGKYFTFTLNNDIMKAIKLKKQNKSMIPVYTKIHCITDLESDDLLALKLLAPYFNKMEVHLCQDPRFPTFTSFVKDTILKYEPYNVTINTEFITDTFINLKEISKNHYTPSCFQEIYTKFPKLEEMIIKIKQKLKEINIAEIERLAEIKKLKELEEELSAGGNKRRKSRKHNKRRKSRKTKRRKSRN